MINTFTCVFFLSVINITIIKHSNNILYFWRKAKKVEKKIVKYAFNRLLFKSFGKKTFTKGYFAFCLFLDKQQLYSTFIIKGYHKELNNAIVYIFSSKTAFRTQASLRSYERQFFVEDQPYSEFIINHALYGRYDW